MKSSLEQKDVLLSTTSEGINNLQIKENHLFNHIDKLAADHDVIASNTMIKITYKKALKDQNAVDTTVDCNTDFDYNNGKNKLIETPSLCNSNISFIVKSPRVTAEEGAKGLMFHSTPKKPDIEKKKKYANGVSLSPKVNHPAGKSSVAKVQKPQDGSPASPKKSKSNKLTPKTELNKRFLKGVKPKASIIQKNNVDTKKTKQGKISEKKNTKLENGVKKKSAVEKQIKKPETLKRKAPVTENESPKPKKIKLNESKQKEPENKSIEVPSSAGKKQVMLVDPDLPIGWTRFIRTKNKGSANEQYVVYVVNPQGKKFRFKWKLRKYLQRTNSSLDADQFFFGLYQRPKTSHASVTETSPDKTEEKPTARGTSAARVSNDPQSEPENRSEDSGSSRQTNLHDSSSDPSRGSDGREILYCDPDLPFGWKRVIHTNGVTGRKQVHIISPDGKIFRRRYRLHEYLIKHQYTHNLDRFHFGLYPKKEGNGLENFDGKTSDLEEGECQKDGNSVEIEDGKKTDIPNSPMYDDPNLPEGWKRFIKIRSCGESAGRMEVVIVSPDGRRHRSRKHLEHYLKQKQLNYKAADFDFTVFGRANLKKRNPSSKSAPEEEEEEEEEEDEEDDDDDEDDDEEEEEEADQERESEPESNDISFFGMKKKFTDKPVPELDINSLKEAVITPEGHLINTVNGLMMCSGLSSSRSARRQRLPRKEHEKQLKSYLSSENDFSWDGCHIPTFWVQRLVKCRGDFRDLEPDAATTIAETAEEFIKKVSLQALAGSDRPECGLRYEDVAEFIDKTKGLSFLKALIPKKITFREYIKLNRPKQFLSFT